MKKVKKIALFSFAVAALSLASCKKSRTCTCTGTATDVETQSNSSGVLSGYPATSTSPISYVDTYPKASKASGKANCISRTETSSDETSFGGITTKHDYTNEITCTLK